ncbi:lipoteichoic acid synthase [Scopulibacillus darangshiensis]|uniref:Lipoteichoic acid synthase n=1 Tax=Scopulibacillus darangshiensis TaxID=442528 RepID=A0A4R2P751_9BACL|nr:LTA synthase family protein [Scopulibacillus darangshiensis]TCP30607.1 lipoteichoic acid synthase [Scopulibacillus darangshiensis]
MKLTLKKCQDLLNKKYSLFFLVVFLFWIKTYLTYVTQFHLGIKNDMQEFLLFINPLSSGLFFFGIALLFKGRGRNIAMIVIHLILSGLLYANVVFYRFFNDFITLPVLFQTKNFGDVGGSAVALMRPYDFLFFLDTLLLIGLIVFKVVKTQANRIGRRATLTVFATAIMIFIVNLSLAEADRPQLLTRTFDRNYLVKYLGAYNFTIYDIIQNTKSSAQRAFADSSDITEVENYTKSNYADPNKKYFGKAKNMNVIYVSMESFQTFMIDRKLNGKEVTPFLNSLAHGKDGTFYFDNFFHQVGQGKTSDAEFMMANSLFPLPQGSVFTTKAQNTYQATPQILKSKGYMSATFHGNYKTFWNRDEMYKSLGIDKFFDADYYDMSAEHTINYGMEDKPFFKESMPYLKNLHQPFLTKFITLSNHFPFKLDKEDQDFPAADTNDQVVNHYFQTAHYMDEALKQFFEELKASGLYDNTVIVLYGDHYGISENHNTAMAKITGGEITPYKNAQLQRVPLFIHVPGVKGGVRHTYGGDVDVRPTVLHLLGVNTKDYISFGTDLLSKEHRSIVPFRNGDFVTPKFTSVSGTCYANPSGKQVDGEKCKPYDKVVKKELGLSDKVVYGDLLRFYKPDGFEPVKRSKISYTGDQTLPLERYVDQSEKSKHLTNNQLIKKDGSETKSNNESKQKSDQSK